MVELIRRIFFEWLHTIEKIFNFQEILEEKRVKLVAIKLTKNASLWWENLKCARASEGRSQIKTWEKMRRELEKKFLSNYYRQEALLKFQEYGSNSFNSSKNKTSSSKKLSTPIRHSLIHEFKDASIEHNEDANSFANWKTNLQAASSQTFSTSSTSNDLNHGSSNIEFVDSEASSFS